MLEKAREKETKNLVVGDARELPFLYKSFDASLIVHVFHLKDRKNMMLEALRVTRIYVISLINERPSDSQTPNPNWQ